MLEAIKKIRMRHVRASRGNEFGAEILCTAVLEMRNASAPGLVDERHSASFDLDVF